MEFDSIRCLLVGSLLVGCSTQSPNVDSPAGLETVEVSGAGMAEQAEATNAELLAFYRLSDLLEFRQRVCLSPPEDSAGSVSGDLSELSQDEMFAQLMIATCAPERTPGRLANLLREAQTLDSLPPGFQALVDLLSDHYGAYRMLEDRLQKSRAELKATEAQLEKTIEGIRAIDAQMYREPPAANGEGGIP